MLVAVLVVVLVPEELAPGAAPVGGVPLGVPVGGVVPLDVAANCLEQPTDTASIGTISSERITLLIMIFSCVDTYRGVEVTPPKGEPLGWELCGVAPLEASGDVPFVVEGTDSAPGAATDCAAHPVETAKIIITNRTSESLLTMVSPCAKVVRRSPLGRLAPVLRQTRPGAYARL
jgi:hypothetical protein